MAEVEEAESWLDLLERNPLFGCLQESTCEKEAGRNIMCEIRGDLFIWMSSDKTKSLLTTNLKRLAAYPDKILVYQELRCTQPPKSEVVRLLPHSSGQYIALQCVCGVSVITLPRHRGEMGEFGGGTKEVLCTAIPIAKDFFTIHHDSNSPLIQASWHPTASFCLALLTSDSTLRIYNIADPDIEVLSLALPSSPTAGVLSMKDPVVAFSLWTNKVFLLQEDSEVTLTQLSHHTCPPDPLPMHPQMDSDCGSDAVAMLVLPSNPCVVVIATTTGTLSHCVYLSDPNSEDLQEEPGHSKQCLYVVDSLSFDGGDSDSASEVSDENDGKSVTSISSLINDPIYSHIYYVVHADGVYQVTLPWLLDLEQYTSSDIPSPTPLHDLPEEKQAHERLLLQTEPGVSWIEGVVIVSEPLLGPTVLGLTSDWTCLVLPLEQTKPALRPVLPSPKRPNPTPQLTDGGFEDVIKKILGDGPYLTKNLSRELSQQEYYEYLSNEIKRLRDSHLLKHVKAKEIMRQKVQSLREKNGSIISKRLKIEDELEDIVSTNEELKEKIIEIQEQCKALGQRASTLLYQLEAQSPVLSQAEEWMSSEVDGLNSHMPLLLQKLSEARRKLEVAHGDSHTPKVDVNSQQSKTIHRSLDDNDKSLRNLKTQIQGLKKAMHGPTDRLNS